MCKIWKRPAVDFKKGEEISEGNYHLLAPGFRPGLQGCSCIVHVNCTILNFYGIWLRHNVSRNRKSENPGKEYYLYAIYIGMNSTDYI